MEIRQLYAFEQVNIDIYLLEDRIDLATALYHAIRDAVTELVLGGAN